MLICIYVVDRLYNITSSHIFFILCVELLLLLVPTDQRQNQNSFIVIVQQGV